MFMTSSVWEESRLWRKDVEIWKKCKLFLEYNESHDPIIIANTSFCESGKLYECQSLQKKIGQFLWMMWFWECLYSESPY